MEDMNNRLAQYLAETYKLPVKRLSGGYTHGAFLLGDERVAKCSPSRDALTEAACLRALGGTIAPRLLEYRDTPFGHLLVMERRPGQNGQTVLESTDGIGLYRLLGQVLAKLHRTDLSDIPGFEPTASVSLPGFEPAASVSLPGFEPAASVSLPGFEPTASVSLPGFEPAASASLPGYVPLAERQRAANALSGFAPADRVLTHGDFGSHNLLVDTDKDGGMTAALLDFEWACHAPACLDAGWVCWLTRLHYPDRADRLCWEFLESYRQQTGLVFGRDTLVLAALYQVCGVLKRAESAPMEDQAEWLRRLRWTLTLL